MTTAKIDGQSCSHGERLLPVIAGWGKPIGTSEFEVTTTNTGYSAEQVSELLVSGELYMADGDTDLYDHETGEPVGTIDWAERDTDFVVIEAGVREPQ